MGRQAGRWAGRQAGRWAGRQVGRQEGGQTGRGATRDLRREEGRGGQWIGEERRGEEKTCD